MPECICLPNCPFFNDRMENMPTMAAVYKRRYCLGDNTSCARFMVFAALGRGKVPADLSPVDVESALKIIESAGKKDGS